METAFATWGGEGPVIAFLGEYDALPALSQQAGRAESAALRGRGQAMAAGTTCWARAALPQPCR